MLKGCRVAKMLKSNAKWLKNVKVPSGWKKIKKYKHYLNYENYSQSVLSKLISGSFALVSLRMVRLSLHVKEFTKSMQCNDKTRWKLTGLH